MNSFQFFRKLGYSWCWIFGCGVLLVNFRNFCLVALSSSIYQSYLSPHHLGLFLSLCLHQSYCPLQLARLCCLLLVQLFKFAQSLLMLHRWSSKPGIQNIDLLVQLLLSGRSLQVLASQQPQFLIFSDTCLKFGVCLLKCCYLKGLLLLQLYSLCFQHCVPRGEGPECLFNVADLTACELLDGGFSSLVLFLDCRNLSCFVA